MTEIGEEEKVTKKRQLSLFPGSSDFFCPCRWKGGKATSLLVALRLCSVSVHPAHTFIRNAFIKLSGHQRSCGRYLFPAGALADTLLGEVLSWKWGKKLDVMKMESKQKAGNGSREYRQLFQG